MSDDPRLPRQGLTSTMVWIIAALVVGGGLTLAGVLAGQPVLTLVGVGVLGVCSTATRVWYLRRGRNR
ncbi:hypothetical protein [Cellulomonas sp. Marseille-Q8402]